MKNSKRQIIITTFVCGLFFAWLALLIYQADRYHNGEGVSFAPRVDMLYQMSFSQSGKNAGQTVKTLYNKPTQAPSTQPLSLSAPRVSTFGNTFMEPSSVTGTNYNTSMKASQTQSSVLPATYVSTSLSSSQNVRSYVSGGVLAGNVSHTLEGISQGVDVASYSTMLASNTLSTAASHLRGGVTTFDSDAPQTPALRRSPTPGDPEEDELPVDGKDEGASATLLLAMAALAYSIIKKRKTA